MREKPARPWTVWTTYAIAGLMFVFLACGVLMGFANLYLAITNPAPQQALVLGFVTALAALYLIVLIGLTLRSFIGRWFGVAGLLLPAGFAAYLLIATALSKEGLQKALIFYDRMAIIFFLIGSIPFFSFLAYRLAFGSREKAFFARPDPVITEPPPPPSFDRS